MPFQQPLYHRFLARLAQVFQPLVDSLHLHPVRRRWLHELVFYSALHAELRYRLHVRRFVARYQSEFADLGMADCFFHVAGGYCRDDFSETEMGGSADDIQGDLWNWGCGKPNDDDDGEFGWFRGWCRWVEGYYLWDLQGFFRFVLHSLI